jgi:hypothetical protein
VQFSGQVLRLAQQTGRGISFGGLNSGERSKDAFDPRRLGLKPAEIEAPPPVFHLSREGPRRTTAHGRYLYVLVLGNWQMERRGQKPARDGRRRYKPVKPDPGPRATLNRNATILQAQRPWAPEKRVDQETEERSGFKL